MEYYRLNCSISVSMSCLKNKNLGIGCKIENIKVPIMGFCDDTVLMVALISHLRKLIEECDNYSKKWM